VAEDEEVPEFTEKIKQRRREGTKLHGGGLWPARLRRAERIGQNPRIQVALIHAATCISRVLFDSCRAQRGATGHSCHAPIVPSPCTSAPSCLRCVNFTVISATSSLSTPYPQPREGSSTPLRTTSRTRSAKSRVSARVMPSVEIGW
jgi:hypothetical protein